MKKTSKKHAGISITRAENTRHGSFPVAAIGASAGGLGAIETFFKNMPSCSGIAFVVITHMDPKYKGMMPELLGKVTPMPVQEAGDGMRVQPDNVYVIPSNKDMAILNGKLQLFEPTAPRGIHMSIDYFFKSLAQDQAEKAVCIIMSGMGTDGTLGLKSIKEHLGIVMVQDPATAEYGVMPQSAVDTGLADYIAPVENLPGKLMSYVKSGPPPNKEDILSADGTIQSSLDKIFVILRAHTGNDFTGYKKNSVYRRIEKRMKLNNIDTLPRYVRFVQQSDTEKEALFKDLLISVTNFFRDPDSFEALKKALVPGILKAKKTGVFRAWSVGCSTGEEAYSLAMVIQELLEKHKLENIIKPQVFATDIDARSISAARAAVYALNIEADVSPKRLARFFVKKDNVYILKKDIRDNVVFAVQNVLSDPPFTRIDLISCRNLLIYFTSEMQKHLIPLFRYALAPEGILFLGSAESAAPFTNMFSAVNNKFKVFKRVNAPAGFSRIGIPVTLPVLRRQETDRVKIHVPVQTARSGEFPEAAQAILTRYFSPPSVIINRQGDILYINGKTGKYLEPSQGQARMNIFDMAKEGLKYELGAPILEAADQNKEIKLTGLRVEANGKYSSVNLLIKPLSEPEILDGLLMVVFEDADEPDNKPTPGHSSQKHDDSAATVRLRRELSSTKEHLQRTLQNMQLSIEEVKSTNEELQSTNEEMQSTNEELMTSKEEMQSMNEELSTVNTEYQRKIEELSASNNDMKNLLDNTELGILFLDNELRIKRFTPQAAEVFSIIGSDIGRPVTDLVSRLKYPGLASDIRNVLEKLVHVEKNVESLKGGRRYSVKIMPYKTVEDFIEGVVITFTDITSLGEMQRKMAFQQYAADMVESITEPLVMLDESLHIIYINPAFTAMFYINKEEALGKLLYELAKGQWNIPQLKKLLNDILPHNNAFNDFLVEHDFPVIGYKRLLLSGRRILSAGKKTELILLAIQDITGRANDKNNEKRK